MKKTVVKIEDVRTLLDQLDKINQLDFDEIEWYENGKAIEIPIRVRKSWLFMGMSNKDFVNYEFYKMTPEDIREFEDETYNS